MALVRAASSLEPYAGMLSYSGDIHNHCDISYGHGSIEDAYRNARLQLDFASVTGHASWHDMPAAPANVRNYHTRGFARLHEQWEAVQDLTEGVHEDGVFASLLSFEWHSMAYGDPVSTTNPPGDLWAHLQPTASRNCAQSSGSSRPAVSTPSPSRTTSVT